MDIQNSLSLHYLESAEVTEEHNIVLALHTGKLESNIIPSNYPGIDIIPSNFNLVGHREKHLIDSSDLPASEL